MVVITKKFLEESDDPSKYDYLIELCREALEDSITESSQAERL